MSNIGIVCEGGGTRGAYTAGVLTWFLDHNLEFDYVNGISAGAFTASHFVSKQRERLKSTCTNWLADKRYMGLGTLMREGTYVGYNFVFDDLKKIEPFDDETFYQNPIAFEFGLYNLNTGKVEFFGKDAIQENYELYKASCKLPFLGNITHYKGSAYLDGGINNMIPVYRAEEAGNPFNIVILTKTAEYVRPPEDSREIALAKVVYRKYPKMIEHLKVRHLKFAQEISDVKQRVAEGKALLLQPSKDMHISRMTKDVALLNQMFQLGYDDCEMRKDIILSFYHQAKEAVTK